THTNSDDIILAFYTLNTLTEEFIDSFLIGLIVPYAIPVPVAYPLLMVAGHRFMVRCSDYHTHFVSQLAIHWVISIEGPAPHCRPQIVSLKAKDQFKYSFIKVTSTEISTVIVFNPSGKAGSLVVKENTSVLNLGRVLKITSFADKQRRTFTNRDISPPIPW